MSAPTADQIVKAMEGLHSRLSEMEKSKLDLNGGVPIPMNQDAERLLRSPEGIRTEGAGRVERIV